MRNCLKIIRNSRKENITKIIWKEMDYIKGDDKRQNSVNKVKNSIFLKMVLKFPSNKQ